MIASEDARTFKAFASVWKGNQQNILLGFKPLKKIFMAYGYKWITYLKVFLKITRGKQQFNLLINIPLLINRALEIKVFANK